ncbi:deazaflavin-dependent oxidoreductase, nitroreductase family [Actinacidiphila yanglinensis]|uniref:Deazaflavin-dependent oxidoreductase, nitroreductase family n=1 Tax=Actinacidiphila yanglinensis TaxID=310779 RepID=A0A1H5S9T7_9ACTN|nr:nitroreductase/quinone reductase family protein [Actinacidiphila yanglinensis]SEF46768.1 deazaflavin-dependent oxidoreductase, nitroreductase family [Actinacidiphila yanglinensis]
MTGWTERIITEFRANAGRVGGRFEGADLLLLTTLGARSALRRTTPVGYAREGGALHVFASNAGAGRHPGWYHNLLAHPQAVVEIGDGAGGVRTLTVRARPLAAAERDLAWARQAAAVPAYGEYEARTTRVIPVVALLPLDLAVPDDGRNRALAHQLRSVHATMRAQLAALRDGGPAAGGELAVHCLAFCDALGAHHGAEDMVLPAFDAAFPRLAPVLARLREEHRQVAGALEELRALLEQGAEPGAVRPRLEALAADAETHFAYEERYLLPALLGEEAGNVPGGSGLS